MTSRRQGCPKANEACRRVDAGGNDTVDGKGGRDTLTGGAGSDHPFLRTAPAAGTSGQALSADQFHRIGQAQIASSRIGYDTTTGALLYDADGSGA